MKNLILIIILLIILFGAIAYIYKFKKRGGNCIGCPHAKQCKNKNCSCSFEKTDNLN